MPISLFPQTVTRRSWSIIIPFIIVVAVVYCGCTGNTTSNSGQPDVDNGKALAKKYCVACHELPNPTLIDRKSWVNGVLPAMAANLGVQTYMGQYYTERGSGISMSAWQDIVAYYTKTSPVNLPVSKPAVAPLNDWAIFSIERPKAGAEKNAMTTMLMAAPDHKLYSGDAAGNLYQWNAGLKSKLIYHFQSAVTGAQYVKDAAGYDKILVTTIGNLPPVNQATGKVLLINARTNDKQPALITDSLPRPVETVSADFNKDGLMDYVTCGFGHDRGALYLIRQQADHTFKKIIISSIAGGEQLLSGDFNNDGWPDVMCLFAQADEGIRMFLNDHKGGFNMQTLLRFPAVYGSSSFQLVDFNHDGKPDILYTCGDNSDYSKVLKPYHGVYIFTNQGNWKFKQTFFYHIDGCTKAIADDFDHSGKLSIAAIAFFSDFKYHPQEGFTYLQQTDAGHFAVHEIPVNPYGRWLEMTVADIDNDGNDDIILGNFSIRGRGLVNQPGFKPNWDMHEPLIVLKNVSEKKL